VQELIHSLAKTLYEKLFNWLIQELNELSSNKKLGYNKKIIISNQKVKCRNKSNLPLAFLTYMDFKYSKIIVLNNYLLIIRMKGFIKFTFLKYSNNKKIIFNRKGLSQNIDRVNFKIILRL
jgi:hypothetical protein